MYRVGEVYSITTCQKAVSLLLNHIKMDYINFVTASCDCVSKLAHILHVSPISSSSMILCVLSGWQLGRFLPADFL